MSSTDRIEKEITLAAPRSRVWRALTDSAEFGAWFGAAFDTPFVVGHTSRGKISRPGYEHIALDLEIEKLEPEHRFVCRWHPYAVEPGVDYSAEPTTQIVFTLTDVAEGTHLTIVESGFDAIPASRRAKAFEMNERGWGGQVKSIAKYLVEHP